MKNPFRGARSAELNPAADQAFASRNPLWPRLRSVTLGLTLITTSTFLGYDLWVWRRAAIEQTAALSALETARNRLATKAQQLQVEWDGSQAELAEAQKANAVLSAAVKDLEQERQKISEAHRSLEDEMRTAVESRDVTISELAGKLTVNILDRVLFASGQAEIMAEGQAVLREVAKVLDKFPDRQIQVLGHTDNVPIHTLQFPSNWELSSARALMAVRFLAEEAGVDPGRLSAVAHGEFRPVADNATPEGRAQNRRIAIVVLPELLTPETAPSPLPSSSLASPPAEDRRG